jgi:hypothetical protein
MLVVNIEGIRHPPPTYAYLRQFFVSMFLKGTVSRDFLPSVFSLNGTPGCPDAFLNIESNSRKNLIPFDYENRLRAMRHSAELIFLLDNAKLKILFYCHEAG